MSELQTVKRMRDAAIAAVSRTSLRSVAKAIGMSPTGLKKFLLGTKPYSPTLRKLRIWYAGLGDNPTQSPTAMDIAAGLSVLLNDLVPQVRETTEAAIIDHLERAYDLPYAQAVAAAKTDLAGAPSDPSRSVTEVLNAAPAAGSFFPGFTPRPVARGRAALV